MKQNKRIAVTGGIGSGKSTLLEIIRQAGFPVFSCDEVSSELWKEASYRRELAALFPDCTVQGEIDKRLLTKKIFEDADELDKLNQFSHEKIMSRLFELAERESLAFFEVPLLFEGGYEGLFDAVIVVMRQREARLDAVCRRDKLSQDQVLSRMKRQTDYENFARDGVYILQNDSTPEQLKQNFFSLLPVIVK